MKVQDVMTVHPALGTPETNLSTIAALMVERNCGVIPIVESTTSATLVGIVTDRDITCRVVARGDDPLSKTAADCMSAPVFSLPESATLEECRRAMEVHQVRRIPIVDKDGACRGIVSVADLADWCRYEETFAIVQAVSHGPQTASRYKDSSDVASP